MRLTDLKIKKIKAPQSGQQTYFDDVLKGFGLRVSQGGTKSFIVLIGRGRKRKTIGRYPDISLAEARIEAKRLQSDHSLLHGNSSLQIQKLSFIQARDQFLQSAEQRNKASTVKEYRRLLVRNFAFEGQLRDVNRQQIISVIDKFHHRPSEAHHVFVAIRTMMNWSLRQGLIDNSPVPPLTFKSEPRSRLLTDEELARLWQRAEQVDYPYGHIIKLLITTGQRRGEIAALRRSWISDDLIVFPQGFTKNKREHRIPISPLTRTILHTIPEQGDLLFPSRGRSDTIISGWSKFKLSFDNPKGSNAPIVSDYTLHDLRRTFSSSMARLGTPIHVTEKLLNHVSGTISGVAAVYNRYSYMDEMQEALVKHDQHVSEICDVDLTNQALETL